MEPRLTTGQAEGMQVERRNTEARERNEIGEREKEIGRERRMGRTGRENDGDMRLYKEAACCCCSLLRLLNVVCGVCEFRVVFCYFMLLH